MSVKKEIVNGVFYIALSKYIGIAINLLITAILARLLTPTDFGIVAIAMIFIVFFEMLSDMGIGPAIIQKQDLNENDLRSIYTLTLYIGLILTVLFLLISGFVADCYSYPLLDRIMKLISISILFHCLDIVPQNLFRKNKKFRYLAFRSLIIHTLCGIISVISAYNGLGIYALLINPVVSPVIIYIIDIYKIRLKFTFLINKNSLNKILSYSIYLYLQSFINYFSRNLDKLIVGKTFSISELAYYEKSYRIMMIPVANLSHVVSPAIQPIFSQFQNDKDLQFNRALKIIYFLSIIAFPLSFFCYFSSEEIILIFLGKQWVGAVSAFKILSLSIGFQILYSPQAAFFQSANATKTMLYCSILTAFLNVLSIVLGCFIFNSMTILCWSIVFTYLFSMFITYYVMIKYIFYNKFLKFLFVLKWPFLLSVCTALLLYIVSYYINSYDLIIRLFVKLFILFLVLFCYDIKFKIIRKTLMK